MRKFLSKKALLIVSLCFTLAALGIWFVIRSTKSRVQIEFDIHINKKEIYLSTYAEPPQFAIWLENPTNGKHKQVFVTYRVSRGDWEGKADVPVAIPNWVTIFRSGLRDERTDEEISISGATPKDEYFRVRAEVRPGSEWICWIEMNLAGDYNEYYPQFNRVTKEEDEFSCGQPALLYRAAIKADEGNQYTPDIASMSLWKNGKNILAPIDSTITTAQNVFDEINIRIIEPKFRIINLNNVEQQDVLK
ncbi:hypothetical protein EZS27_012219 [termite gut metagenome]|uniref:Uncharacterized protein n=1 Tax=termite gut metagenome TaxID=433724 RepID=A0A5J4S2Z9_9ZZZZ